MGTKRRRQRSGQPSRRARWWWLGAAATVLGTAIFPAQVDGGPPVATGSPDGSVITAWNQVAMDVLTPSGRPLLTQPAVIAAMHVAMYDAVMAIEGRAEPFQTEVSARPGASPVAAAAAAAHRVLVGYLPGSAGGVRCRARRERSLTCPMATRKPTGSPWARRRAGACSPCTCATARSPGPLPPVLPPGRGVWVPTPPATAGLNPWLALATPFSLRAADQFRPAPPPPVDSACFRRALEEIRQVGGTTSAVRTPEQTATAQFWADQPVAQGQRALRAKAQSLGWGLAATARLYAAVMTSEADAAIACWDAKYRYQYWRPWQSVPEIETGWTPLLSTPNHPEFPSAHGCVTGALAFALERILGTADIDVTIDAANVGAVRHYATSDELVTELGEARIWGGLHYRFSVDAGVRIAQRVVSWNLSHNFRLRR